MFGNLDALLEAIDAKKAGWIADGDMMLICPCGHRIELDGECPEGHVSPLKAAGLI